MDEKKKLIGFVLIFIGICLTLWIPIQQFIVVSLSGNLVEEFESGQIVDNQIKEGMFDFKNVESIKASSILSLSEFENSQAIGVISIPEVEMKIPILNGMSQSNLMVGAGTMKKDQKIGVGNYALAGHNWRDKKSLFSPLHQVEKGMVVSITDKESTHHYKIDTIMLVTPDRIDLINDTETPKLTLVTCNYDGTERLIIQASIIEGL